MSGFSETDDIQIFRMERATFIHNVFCFFFPVGSDDSH